MREDEVKIDLGIGINWPVSMYLGSHGAWVESGSKKSDRVLCQEVHGVSFAVLKLTKTTKKFPIRAKTATVDLCPRNNKVFINLLRGQIIQTLRTQINESRSHRSMPRYITMAVWFNRNSQISQLCRKENILQKWTTVLVFKTVPNPNQL